LDNSWRLGRVGWSTAKVYLKETAHVTTYTVLAAIGVFFCWYPMM
jgi:hypothetical protein